jgi:hypothetical protein
LRVDEQMALAALDLLATVVSTGPTHLSSFDRLAVDDCGCGLSGPADRATIALAQGLGHVLPGAVLAPQSIVGEDSAARGILMREQPPLGSCAQQVKDRIDDAT